VAVFLAQRVTLSATTFGHDRNVVLAGGPSCLRGRDYADESVLIPSALDADSWSATGRKSEAHSAIGTERQQQGPLVVRRETGKE